MSEREDRLMEMAPKDELALIIREATASVERDLAIEDKGWLNLSGITGDVITAASRIDNLKLSRLYSVKDPLGRQSIRLWTDYTFGQGITWNIDEKNKKTLEVLERFWGNNPTVYSARGQRKTSDKLLIDGEVFFAIFLGKTGDEKIRLIDPLEITEIITNPDDREDVRFYRREWTDTAGKGHDVIYRDWTNEKNEAALDSQGATVQKTDDALIYHLPYNTISQRGNPLLLPALDWIRYYRKFLSSRIAIMLALARFAWLTKVKGGQTAVDRLKNTVDGETPEAGSWQFENEGSATTPIKTDTGASGAAQDGRMIKLMIIAAVGLYEQYFGDISTGNLATSKTVEQPMVKQFQSLQSIWKDTYKDINNIVLKHNSVPEEAWYVDIDFPLIAPEDLSGLSDSIQKMVQTFPGFAFSPEVLQMALISIGVDDTQEALDSMSQETGENKEAAMIKALRLLREALINKE